MSFKMHSILANTKRMLASKALKSVLRVHSWSYDIAGRLALRAEGGIHPKHGIIAYEEWFLEQIKPDWVIVDIGSNTGIMGRKMASKAAFVYGIDIVQSLVEAATQNTTESNIKFFCADATQFDYSVLNPFDCITLSNVLEHIQNRVPFLLDLKNKAKWRDPNHKRFLIRVPLIERDWISVYKKNVGVDYR